MSLFKETENLKSVLTARPRKTEKPFPRLEYVRKFKRKKEHLVFGPFVSGGEIAEVIKILRKAFLLRDCTLTEFRSRKEPCLLFQMKQCSAPCVDRISESDYQKNLQQACAVLEGRAKKSLQLLDERMMEASELEEYERAIILRDSIGTLKKFVEHSVQENVELDQQKNVDIIAWYIGETELDLTIYIVRNGLLLGHKHFDFLRADFSEDDEEEICRAILQYYLQESQELPQLIVLPVSEEHRQLLKNSLTQVDFKIVGKKYEGLSKLAYEQAKGEQELRLKHETSVYLGLNRLKDLLGLKERPKTLECYDIAIFQGKSPTASQIVFYEGRPEKKLYRHFHLEERPEGNNDFAMMREVLRRRLKHGNLPDVFVVLAFRNEPKNNQTCKQKF